MKSIDFEKGVFTVSHDLELAWGTLDERKVEGYKEHFEKTREVVGQLLNLYERYSVSATWAVVGHLLLNQCEKQGGLTHPEVVRPDYDWFEGDWFNRDPCTSIEEDPFWYGEDIVNDILSCEQHQELGCHSFSHIIYGDDGCSKEVAESDLSKCMELAQKLGIELRSFVFPRNSIGHLDILSKYGFTCFRGKTNRWYEKNERVPKVVIKLFRLLEEGLAFPPSPAEPRKRNDLLEVPASMQYRSIDHVWRFLPASFRVKRAKRGIERAVKQKKVFHLWLHPFNLGKGTGKLLNGLEKIIAFADRRRQRGELKILPLEEVYDLVY